MQRDVAVGVQLADRGAQPVGRADLDDRVDGEPEQLAAAHPGAGEGVDYEPVERVGQGAGGGHERGGLGVVEEPGQRLVLAGPVAANTGTRAGVSS